MDLSLSEEQEHLLHTVKEFAEREVKPVAAALDKEARFPAELVARPVPDRSRVGPRRQREVDDLDRWSKNCPL